MHTFRLLMMIRNTLWTMRLLYSLTFFLTRLEKSGTGCFIGHQYYGCITYADDLVLLCPSVKGLWKMTAICAKGTMCLAFDRTKDLIGDNNDSTPIFLNGSKLQWVKCVKHLGN